MKSVTELAGKIVPSSTILFFGAGSSIPSGAPSGQQLANSICEKFKISGSDLSLMDISTIVEKKFSRRDLVDTIFEKLPSITPKQGLKNISLYDWHSIYTTNYDDLIEKAYKERGAEIDVFSSNFDFGRSKSLSAAKLYKLHGTIGKDISLGHSERIVITHEDYDLTADYRKALYDNLASALNQCKIVIIGHSLSDPHIKEIIERASRINSEAHKTANINIITFEEDDNRAFIYESRGINAYCGGIDSFFASIKSDSKKISSPEIGESIDKYPALVPVTIDVNSAIRDQEENFPLMFNGRAAQYGDIASRNTFDRTKTDKIADKILEENISTVTIIGASGVGKTTLARQVLTTLVGKGIDCWEHVNDYPLPIKEWCLFSEKLSSEGKLGVLFIDEAHTMLHEVNELVDSLGAAENFSLKIIVCSSRHNWSHRIKSRYFYQRGDTFNLNKLDNLEIDRLIRLISSNETVSALVENSFSGFSRFEQQRRLAARCEADMFVCLKNIFANSSFDDIVLEEFAALPAPEQELYRHVAAMESCGVKVHRQLILRTLNIDGSKVGPLLSSLEEIISEYDVDKKNGIFAWRGRHVVISDIIAKHKYHDQAELKKLFENIIRAINPTHFIEIQTIRQICNFRDGIGRITDRGIQNQLLRSMISRVPGERVPRHRLLRNLIHMNEFDRAEVEMRLYENDFGSDTPIRRYRVKLLLARVERVSGLMEEDRRKILDDARNMALNNIERNKENKDLLRTYAEVGIVYFKLNKSLEVFDDAIARLRVAEQTLGDPEITSTIRHFEHRVSSQLNTHYNS